MLETSKCLALQRARYQCWQLQIDGMKAIALGPLLLQMVPQNVGCELEWNVMAHWHALHAECAIGA